MPLLKKTNIKRAIGVFTVGAFLSAGVWAQDYPAKPITLVVGYSTGGPTDILARQIAPELSKILGQNIIIENKPGVNGNIGGQAVVRAKADGYTLLFGDLTLATNPYLLKDMPFDPLKDLQAVASIGTAPLALVVHPSVPARTVPELIQYSHANPSALSNGTAGMGNLTHLAGEVLKDKEKLNFQQVPYKGSGPALTDLIGGQISMVITGLSSSIQHIQSQKVHALAITGKQRSPLLPQVPTFSEALGKKMPELELGSWWGIFAPSGVPDEVVQKINTSVNQALQAESLRTRLSSMNIDVDAGDPQFMKQRLLSEYRSWGSVIKNAKIQPQ